MFSEIVTKIKARRTQAGNGSIEMTEDGRPAIRHLSLDRELCLDVHVAEPSTHTPNRQPRYDKDLCTLVPIPNIERNKSTYWVSYIQPRPILRSL